MCEKGCETCVSRLKHDLQTMRVNWNDLDVTLALSSEKDVVLIYWGWLTNSTGLIWHFLPWIIRDRCVSVSTVLHEGIKSEQQRKVNIYYFIHSSYYLYFQFVRHLNIPMLCSLYSSTSDYFRIFISQCINLTDMYSQVLSYRLYRRLIFYTQNVS